MGSIDLVASARSVLHVEKDTEDEDVRIVHHVKSSAATKGADFRFEIRSDTGFRWLEAEKNDNHTVADEPVMDLPKNKHELAAVLITKALKEGPVESTAISCLCMPSSSIITARCSQIFTLIMSGQR